MIQVTLMLMDFKVKNTFPFVSLLRFYDFVFSAENSIVDIAAQETALNLKIFIINFRIIRSVLSALI